MASITETIIGDPADGWVTNNGFPWVDIHDASDGNFVDTTAYSDDSSIMVDTGLLGYVISRVFLYFDLSVLPTGATVLSATLTVRGYGYAENEVSVQEGSQSDTLGVADFDAYAGSLFDYLQWQATMGDPGIDNVFTFNAAGLTYLKSAMGSTAKLCLREYSHDYLNLAPNSGEHFRQGLYFAECSDIDIILSPKLTIEFESVGLSWYFMDKKISMSQTILETLMPTLLGHGLHVLHSDKLLFREIMLCLEKRIQFLRQENRFFAQRVLLFFKRFFGA